MGFYIRKSLRVGPLRFNLSKSGIGVSAGIRGFRIGSGPHGNYIHMGRNGLYYRMSLPLERKTPKQTPVYSKAHIEPTMKKIESGDVCAMVDSSSAKLLSEINSKHKKQSFWPIVFISTIILMLLPILIKLPSWYSISVLVLSIPIFAIAIYRDIMVKTVVLFYEMEGQIETAYKILHNGFNQMARCKGIWHIESQGKVKEKKYHAGASKLVCRKKIHICKGHPPYFKTNIAVPYIPVGRQTIYFFPDRVLIYDQGNVGAVSYSDLELNISQISFVEGEYVHSDTKIIDYTWQFVNKNGDPDRRFKNNQKLPVVLYDELHFSSSNGLNELIQLSRIDSAEQFNQAIIAFSDIIITKSQRSLSQTVLV